MRRIRGHQVTSSRGYCTVHATLLVQDSEPREEGARGSEGAGHPQPRVCSPQHKAESRPLLPGVGAIARGWTSLVHFRLEPKRSAAGVRPAFACRAACQELAAFWRACVRACVRAYVCARVCVPGGAVGGKAHMLRLSHARMADRRKPLRLPQPRPLADWSHQLGPTAGGRRRARCSETLGLDKWKTQRYLERIEAGYPSNP